MECFYATIRKLFIAVLLAGTFFGSQAQTTLNAGDIIFTGYDATPGATTNMDAFSFVLLRSITASTQISFTDRGYQGSGWQAAGTTEGTITWTAATALPMGTEILIIGLTAGVYNTSTNTSTPNGTVLKTEGIPTNQGLSLASNAGDQIIAFQGVGISPSPSGPATFIAGIHFAKCNASTSAATWDVGGCTYGPNTSAIPPGLTGGTNAFYTGVIGNAVPNASRFTRAGAPYATAAALRAAIMEPGNWEISETTLAIPMPGTGGSLITPPPTTPTISAHPVNRTICANSNTTFSVTASNATAYKWQVDAGVGFTDVPAAGVYSGVTSTTLTITGAAAAMNGYQYRCVVSNGTGSINSNPGTLTISAISTSGTQSEVSCFGGSNATASVTPSGGITPYTYSWSPTGGTNATASGLSQGTYTVTVTDNIGCTATRTFNITQPATSLSATTSQTDATCGSSGSAGITVSGGAGGYTYLWTPSGGTAATATNLAAGGYSVTATDANGCTITRNFTITNTSNITGTISKTDVSCNGGSNGSATVTPGGGTGPYTFSWAPSGGTGATATGLAPGVYTVTITAANGCSGTASVTITEPPLLQATAGAQTNIACNGAATGSATVNVTGGSGPYSYSWSPSGGTGATASGLTAGTYTVTVTDNNTCQATQTFVISQPATALSVTPSQTNVSCNGGTNGTATVTVTGGTPGYTYSWAPVGGTAATASGLAAGTYTCTITDANGCTHQETITISQPATLTATSSKTDVLCNGGSTGTATVTPSGGTAPYTYLWSPSGGTGATATGLAIGNYSCLITDAHGCSITRNFTINQPTTLGATTAQTNATCSAPGMASVTPFGGAGSYTYLWSPSGSTTQTVTTLAPGSHSCLITDANGCTITKNFTITTTNTLVASTAQTSILCRGSNTGWATVVPSGAPGPYTYSWSPSGGTDATASNLAAGNYSVTITAANGCSIVRNFTITEPATALDVTPSAQTNIACNGSATGSATASVTGGTGAYTYSWSPSGGTAATASGLAAGTYTCTVTDANGCTDAQSFTLTEPAALVASAAAQTNVSCNGGANGSATVNVTGGTGTYTYSWSPSGGTAATASGLAAGTYTCTVTDAYGCTAAQSFTITEPTVLSATTSKTDVSCNGGANGSATVTATGGTPGYTYSWSPSGGTAATASGLTTGTYTCTITDANGCFITRSALITQPVLPVVSSVSVPVPGTYTGGQPLEFTVRYSEAITVGGTPVLSLTLNTGTVSASYNRGSGTTDLVFSYTVDPDDQDPDGIAVSSLSLNGGTLQTSTGCPASTTLNSVAPTSGILVHNPIAQTITFNTLAAKTYGDADFDPGATASSTFPVTYSSSNLAVATIVSGQVHILSAGTTTLTAAQAGNTDYLPATETQVLTVNPKEITVTVAGKTKTYGDADPALTYSAAPALIAGDAFSGSLIRTAGENADSYAITQGTLALSSNYQLIYTGANLVINKAELTVSSGDKTICYGDAAGTIPVSYAGFRNGENANVLTNPPTVALPSYNGAGNYTLTPAGGAATNYRFTYVDGSLTVLPVPSGNINTTATAAGVVAGYQLMAPSGPDYAWNTGESAPVITVRASGNYSVRVTNQEGCHADFSTQVQLATFSVPNTFSPNGDGINDYWVIPELKNYPNAYVLIVNRDGQTVFESRNFTHWDGRRAGQILPAGVYFYRVRKQPGDAPVTGWLNLVR